MLAARLWYHLDLAKMSPCKNFIPSPISHFCLAIPVLTEWLSSNDRVFEVKDCSFERNIIICTNFFIGNGWVFFSSHLHSRMFHEDHSLWTVHAFGRLPAERMESPRLHYRCYWVWVNYQLTESWHPLNCYQITAKTLFSICQPFIVLCIQCSNG